MSVLDRYIDVGYVDWIVGGVLKMLYSTCGIVIFLAPVLNIMRLYKTHLLVVHLSLTPRSSRRGGMGSVRKRVRNITGEERARKEIERDKLRLGVWGDCDGERRKDGYVDNEEREREKALEMREDRRMAR